jgi:prepilin-type N-terminal cleavage/methylation domain-containing protein
LFRRLPGGRLGATPSSMMPSPSSPRRDPSDGFTLIELLVVISIIAILAGLLLPVVSSVMNNANKTSAKSTEQQIVAAVKNYETEYGAYPVEPGATAVDVTFDNTSNTSPSTPTTGLYGHNLILFNVLRAINNSNNAAAGGDATYQALNSRQIVYFEATDVKNPAHAASGFIPASAAGTTIKGNTNNNNVTPAVGDLVDPWGNLFYVRIDANYTGLIENPYNASTDSGGSVSYVPNPPTDTAGGTVNYSQVLHLDVVAWSPGQDGHMGTSPSANAAGTFSPTSVGDDALSWQ